jgi:serine phosphatase RsbU (regulator of sigma subunit)
VLVIFSDGITETANTAYENYGEERLKQQIIKSKKKSSRQIAYSILDDVIKFSKDGKYNDDKTLVVVKRIS